MSRRLPLALSAVLLFAALAGCRSTPSDPSESRRATPTAAPAPAPVASADPDAKGAVIEPKLVTVPVRHEAGRSALWVHPTDPAGSVVVGTDLDGDGALYSFDLNGNVLQRVGGLQWPSALATGGGLVVGGESVDFVLVMEPSARRVRAFRLPDLAALDNGDLVVFAGAADRVPHGIALYRRPADGAVFAVVGGNGGTADGALWQYRLGDNGRGRLTMTKVREFGRFSGREGVAGLIVDEALGYVYATDGGAGIRKYAADPDAREAGRQLAFFATSGFAGDLGGIALYDLGAGLGYLAVANPRADTLRIFPREGTPAGAHDHPLRASIRLGALGATGTAVTSAPIPGFPGGLLVASSADRTFHYYAWEDVAREAGLRLRRN